MNDRKHRDLPPLPRSWKWTTVGELTEVVRGASPRPKGDPRYFGGAIPWIMISDVTKQPGKYLYKTREGVTPAGAELSRKIPAGELILSNSGTVCVPKILKVDGCIHDGFVAFPTLKDRVDLNFAYYWFECVRQTIIQENRQGVTQVNLNTTIVRDMHFPLPPIDQQRDVVAEIEKQLTRLEAGVAALRSAQVKLKRYRAAVLKAACEGKLVPTEAELARERQEAKVAEASRLCSSDETRRRDASATISDATENAGAENQSRDGSATLEDPGFETGAQLLERILTERRLKWNGKGKYKEPATPDTAKLPLLPDGWARATIDQLAVVVRGASPRPAGDPRYFGGHIPWITVGPITADLKPYLSAVPDTVTEDGKERSRYIEAETLLLTNSGATLGVPKITLISGCINDGVAALLDVDYPLKLYLLYYLHSQTKKLRGVNQGAAQPNLNTSIIKSIHVPLPPLTEQQRIVAEVQRRWSIVDELETTIKVNLQRGNCLRQSILQQAISGGLTD